MQKKTIEKRYILKFKEENKAEKGNELRKENKGLLINRKGIYSLFICVVFEFQLILLCVYYLCYLLKKINYPTSTVGFCLP